MKINEIYKSIQGESTHAGRPCIFIRTTGCDLRCSWCDTPFAFHEGHDMTIPEIVRAVETFNCSLVELTGGEPLLQKESFTLTKILLDQGYEVLIETSGAHPIADLDPRAVVILDIKCPRSGMTHAMYWENLGQLRDHDEVKFVVSDYEDYLWATSVLKRYPMVQKRPVLLSPVFGQLEPQKLVRWVLQDRLPVRVQLQIHKYIWDPEMRGV